MCFEWCASIRHDRRNIRDRCSTITTSSATSLLVFTDLDGSLLDHDTYSFAAAQPALTALKQKRIPLILVSSKTLAELANYRQQLALEHPVVGENGASLHVPPDYFGQFGASAKTGVTREQIQAVYASLKSKHQYCCQAFYEMGVSGIVEATGLSATAALRANDRQASEPILWQDTPGRAEQFVAQATAQGLRCTRGGRFLHLMTDTSKEAAVQTLIAGYAANAPDTHWVSMSLGDGPNDLGMLACTDIAVVIAGKHGQPMPLEAGNRVLKPSQPGPAGWNTAVLQVLGELDN